MSPTSIPPSFPHPCGHSFWDRLCADTDNRDGGAQQSQSAQPAACSLQRVWAMHTTITADSKQDSKGGRCVQRSIRYPKQKCRVNSRLFFLFKGNRKSKSLLRSSSASYSSTGLTPMRRAPGFSRCPQPSAGDSNFLFQVGQRMQSSSQLGKAGVASFTCTAREELGGLLPLDRTWTPLPASIVHTSCPVHAFKDRDYSEKTPTQTTKTALLPRRKGQRGGLQQHKPHPVSINQTTQRRAALA